MEKLNIQINRLRIRNLQISDLEAFHFYRSQEVVMLYQYSDIMNLEQAKNFSLSQKDKLFGKAGEWGQYGIVDKIQQKLIGGCAIHLQADDPRIAEIGMTISPLYQR